MITGARSRPRTAGTTASSPRDPGSPIRFVLHNHTTFSARSGETHFTADAHRTVAELVDFATRFLQPQDGDGSAPYGIRLFRSRGPDDTPRDGDEILARQGQDGGDETLDRAFGEEENHLHGFVNPAAGRPPGDR
jgi:hypothetical protein